MTRQGRDLSAIAVGALVVFAVSAREDLFNLVVAWLYRHETWQLDEVFTVTVFLVLAFGWYAWRRHRELAEAIAHRQRVEAENARIVPELTTARSDVSTLRRLLPICSVCKRIRNDKGYWDQVEVYIENNLATRFDTGTCPDCAREQYRAGSVNHGTTSSGHRF